MEQKLFDRADTVVCICEGLRREIARRSPKQKICVVQNGVDTSSFVPKDKSPMLVEKYRTRGKTVIGFIGSFFTFEGLADLVKSMPLVKNEINDVVLLMVGTGVEDQNLRTLADETGLAGNTVIFTGRVPHEKVQDYYSLMDILVYPRISKRITELVTPLKPLEAMAMEKQWWSVMSAGSRNWSLTAETVLFSRPVMSMVLPENWLIWHAARRNVLKQVGRPEKI